MLLNIFSKLYNKDTLHGFIHQYQRKNESLQLVTVSTFRKKNNTELHVSAYVPLRRVQTSSHQPVRQKAREESALAHISQSGSTLQSTKYVNK